MWAESDNSGLLSKHCCCPLWARHCALLQEREEYSTDSALMGDATTPAENESLSNYTIATPRALSHDALNCSKPARGPPWIKRTLTNREPLRLYPTSEQPELSVLPCVNPQTPARRLPAFTSVGVWKFSSLHQPLLACSALRKSSFGQI